MIPCVCRDDGLLVSSKPVANSAHHKDVSPLARLLGSVALIAGCRAGRLRSVAAGQCRPQAARGHRGGGGAAPGPGLRPVRGPDRGGEDGRGARARRGLHRAAGGARRRDGQGRRPALHHRPAPARGRAAPGRGQCRARHRRASSGGGRRHAARGRRAPGAGQYRSRPRPGGERPRAGGALSHARPERVRRQGAVRPDPDQSDRARSHRAGRPRRARERAGRAGRLAGGHRERAGRGARRRGRGRQRPAPARLHLHQVAAGRAHGPGRGPGGRAGRTRATPPCSPRCPRSIRCT